MPLDNPFFVKEIRVLSRRQWSPLAGIFVTQGLLLFAPLLVAERLLFIGAHGDEAVKRMALALLGLLHAVVCCFAGWQMGRCVFVEEHRQGTLESLRLVSLSPWRLIPQKLLFPLYALLLVCLSALPFYAALVLRGHCLPRDLEWGLVLAGCAGLVGFAAMLIVPPQGLTALRNLNARTAWPSAITELTYVLLPAWLIFVLLHMGSDWIGAATGLRDSPLRHSPFFATTIRSDQKLAILMVAYGGAALGGALAAASPASRWATGLRRGALVVATGLSYCSLLGQLWGTLSPTYRLAGMALPLVLLAWAYFARTSDLGRGALLSSREIRWLSRRWDNPVFIRDLRAALRAASLTRQSSSVLLWAAVAVSASAWLTTVAPLSTVFTVYAGPAIASSPGFLFRASACLAFFSPMLLCFLFIMPGERAQKLWKKEHQLGTFSQLLASPLPTATLVQGRWMASALVGAAAPVTCVLLSVAGLFAFAATRPAELGLYVALELYLVSVGLVVAASAAAMVQPEKGAGRTNWLFQLLALLGFTAEVLLALPMALPLLNPFSDVGSPPALVVLGLTVAPLNVWLAYWLYRRTVVALERMRCSDVG